MRFPIDNLDFDAASSESRWKEKFNKDYKDDFLFNPGTKQAIKDFISTEIIEKIIEDIPDIEFADYPSGFEATESIKQQLRDKYLN